MVESQKDLTGIQGAPAGRNGACSSQGMGPGAQLAVAGPEGLELTASGLRPTPVRLQLVRPMMFSAVMPLHSGGRVPDSPR